MLNAKVKGAILAGTVQPPANRVRWSCRSMARAQKVSPSTVQRPWASNDIQPHLTRSLKVSNFGGRFGTMLKLAGLGRSCALNFLFQVEVAA
jgi:hypothetical protein